MLRRVAALIQGVLHDPQRRAPDLQCLTDAERHKVLVEWNETDAKYPNTCLHSLFERQVQRTPDSLAVVYNDQSITYQELNERANQLARYLTTRGAGPGRLVGICVERSIEMLAGLLAILKAGAAYVPLDPAFPSERLAFMLKDARVTLVVTQSKLIGQLPEYDGQTVYVDTDRPAIERESAENLSTQVTPDAIAYVIYTSGSTGVPKGVLGLHRGAVNRLAWMWKTYPFEPGERSCQRTSLNFVDSVWEIFGPLLQGVPNVVIPDAVFKDPRELVSFLAEHRVTRIVLVPSWLRVILDTEVDLQHELSRLTHWISSGEDLPADLVQRFHRRLPNGLLLNLYGSSEVSADVTCFDTSERVSPRCVPIGRPIANTKIYLLDPRREPVPVGATGEIYVGGAGLARGYLNRSELTEERFIADPFGSERDGRLYKTGDLARYRPDGTLEFIGRVDRQVKSRGYRIELGEVEAALREHAAVRDAIVVARTDIEQDTRLIAYVVCDQASIAVSTTDVRNFVKKKLPIYMVPSKFIQLAVLPQTPNGKVDHLKLRALITMCRTSGDSAAPARRSNGNRRRSRPSDAGGTPQIREAVMAHRQVVPLPVTRHVDLWCAQLSNDVWSQPDRLAILSEERNKAGEQLQISETPGPIRSSSCRVTYDPVTLSAV
jgi:amino acid adenylation domain-containing protein